MYDLLIDTSCTSQERYKFLELNKLVIVGQSGTEQVMSVSAHSMTVWGSMTVLTDIRAAALTPQPPALHNRHEISPRKNN